MNELPVDRKFKLTDTELLLNGSHHDDDDEVDLMHEHEINMQYLGRDDTFKQQKIEQFENAARKIIYKNNRDKKFQPMPKHEHIPLEVKKEFDLPEDIGEDQVSWESVIKADYIKKRQTPIWSGQDILTVGLTPALSSEIVN